MRKLFVISAGLAVAGAAFAQASMAQTGDALMEVAYGNTVLVQIEGFYEGKTYYDADHTFRTVTAEGTTKGKWRVDGDKLCVTGTEPVSPEDCNSPLKPRKVGDVWTQADPASGIELKISIVAGR